MRNGIISGCLTLVALIACSVEDKSESVTVIPKEYWGYVHALFYDAEESEFMAEKHSEIQKTLIQVHSNH
ncbi:hypothetical protein U8V72_15380 [Priestia filamentosa]|uniref:hypothetical protein n=1 Tax=Priestia filamentosa TaxID=1402861 RepID=UPI0005894F07